MLRRDVSTFTHSLFAVTLSVLLTACGGGGGGGGGDENPVTGLQLAEVDALYPAPVSGPLNTVYECVRYNSGLLYYLYLRPDGVLDWQFETDAHDVFRFSGIYDHSNSIIHLQITDPGFPLDETTTDTVTHLGLVYNLTTPQMQCGAIGHGYDEPISVAVRHYQCPRVSLGAGSAVNLGGSIFRQRDTYPTGSIDPIIRRGYGVYRRTGDVIYAYFGTVFDDVNLFSATLTNGELQLQIDGFGSAGVCDRT